MTVKVSLPLDLTPFISKGLLRIVAKSAVKPAPSPLFPEVIVIVLPSVEIVPAVPDFKEKLVKGWLNVNTISVWT